MLLDIKYEKILNLIGPGQEQLGMNLEPAYMISAATSWLNSWVQFWEICRVIKNRPK